MTRFFLSSGTAGVSAWGGPLHKMIEKKKKAVRSQEISAEHVVTMCPEEDASLSTVYPAARLSEKHLVCKLSNRQTPGEA